MLRQLETRRGSGEEAGGARAGKQSGEARAKERKRDEKQNRREGNHTTYIIIIEVHFIEAHSRPHHSTARHGSPRRKGESEAIPPGAFEVEGGWMRDVVVSETTQRER